VFMCVYVYVCVCVCVCLCVFMCVYVHVCVCDITVNLFGSHAFHAGHSTPAAA